MAVHEERFERGKSWRSVFFPASDVQELEWLPEFREDPGFSVANAFITAWFAHLMYVEDVVQRRELLMNVGWIEAASFETQQIRWSQLHPTGYPDQQVVVFRGTSDPKHWLFNINTILTRWPHGGKVHGGFVRAFSRVVAPLELAIHEKPARRILFAGHSLGGALALLAGSQFPAHGLYTFGCPRAGNPSFARTVMARTEIYRVVYDQDIVTTIPYRIDFLNELSYKHAGRTVHLRPHEELLVDDERFLPHSKKSWQDALYATFEGDHVGEPLPAMQDHAPSGYVRELRRIVERGGFA